MDLEGVESLRRRGKSNTSHVDELVGEDRLDYGLVISVIGEVRENCVGVDVGILSRVDSREVLILD